jgi:hypothetical protein
MNILKISLKNKNFLYFIYLPIVVNFIVNLVNRYSIENISKINLYNLFSTILLFTIFVGVGFLIKKLFSLPYISAGIVVYFFSFFVLDNIVLFFYNGLSFSHLFFITNIIWIIIFIIFSSNKPLILISLSLYGLLNLFNIKNLDHLIINKNIIGDVKDIHYPNVKNIYEVSYFYSINNQTLEGYPQISSYIHSLINLVSINTESFYSLSSSINSLFLLFVLFFIEAGKSRGSKFFLVVIFSCLVFNSQWLKFLFVDSLMTEGILSYVFAVSLLSCLGQINNLSRTSYLVFFTTGLLYLSKQFFSTLILVLVLLFILKKETRKYAITGLFGVLLKEIRSITFFSNIQKDYHLKEVDLVDTFFDLLLIRDLKIGNISIILKNLIGDMPFFILVFYLFVMTLIFLYLYRLKHEKINIILFIIYLNFLLIFILYITIWRTMELESPIRYMLNLLPVILILQSNMIDIFNVNIYNKASN